MCAGVRSSGLYIFRSNDMAALGDALVSRMASHPPADPMEPETLLVGSTGLRDWLRWRIARRLAIAAQLRFVYSGAIGTWIYNASRACARGDDLAWGLGAAAADSADADDADSPWARDRLVWVIASELVRWGRDPSASGPASGPVSEGDALARYLRRLLDGTDAGERPDSHTISVPVFSLAHEIASLFTRYHAQRPMMVSAWAEGRDITYRGDGVVRELDTDVAWQPELWRRIQQRLGDRDTPSPVAALSQLGGSFGHSAAARQLDDAARKALLQVLPSHLSIFGVTGFTPLQLSSLERIQEVIPVDVYLLAPTPFFLGDQTRGALYADQSARNEARSTYLREPRSAWIDAGAEGAHDGTAFDAFSTHVCPMMAAFGRVPRATQLLIEESFPNAPDGEVDFVHPLRRRDTHDGHARPTVLERVQADVFMLESEAYRGSGRCGPYREDADGSSDALVSLRGAREIDADDRSFGFHACYGPARQVDTVRDLIVDALATDPTLRPGDIVVMTPDIATYASWIEATFSEHRPFTQSRERTGIPGIPIRIQDRSIRSTNPVAHVLVSLLVLGEGRQEVTEIVSLLSLEPVATRFDIQFDELATIETWLRDAGARWGLDGETRARHGVAPTADHTLVSAIERIALGVLMPLEGATQSGTRGFGGLARAAGSTGADVVYPLDQAGDRDLAARTLVFLESIASAIAEVRGSTGERGRTLDEWIALLSSSDASSPGLLQRFVALPASRAWQKAQVMDELAALARDSRALQLARGLDDDPSRVSAAALARWMTLRMDKADRRATDGLDAVTFCSMMPVRSVPYRWVILLGVDGDVFPRQGTRPAWDLIARDTHLYDRNPRDEDRALFLDAILSARDAFHVVYTGRTPDLNAVVPAAAPVVELMEIMDRRFDVAAADGENAHRASAWLTRTYALQVHAERDLELPVNPAAQAPRPRTYHRASYRAALALREGRASTRAWHFDPQWEVRDQREGPPDTSNANIDSQDGATKEVTLDALVRFFQDPLGTYLRHELGVAWPRPDDDASSDLLPTASGILDRIGWIRALREHDVAGWDSTMRNVFSEIPTGVAGDLEGEAIARRAAEARALSDALLEGLTTRHVTVLVNARDPGSGAACRVRVTGEVTRATWRDPDFGITTWLEIPSKGWRAERAGRPWLELLTCMATGLPVDGCAVMVVPHDLGAALQVHRVAASDLLDTTSAANAAKDALQALVETWLRGSTAPLCTLAKNGTKVVETILKELVRRSAGDLEPKSDALREHTHAIRQQIARGALVPDADAFRVGLDKARTGWAPDRALQSVEVFTRDEPNPTYQRVFADRGPWEWLGDRYLRDSWDVFGRIYAVGECFSSVETVVGQEEVS